MKTKLLFLNGHLNTGGVEKSLLDTLRCLDYDKYDVDLLLFEEFGDYINDIPEEVNVRLFDLHNTYGSVKESLLNCIKARDMKCFIMKLLFTLRRFFGLKVLRLARGIMFGKRKYDYAIGYRSGICTDVAVYTADCKHKITWWHHGEFNVPRDEYEEVSQRCDKVISVSEVCAEMIRENVPSIADKITVIPNMVDKEFLMSKCETASPYDNNDNLRLVTVSRLSPEKHTENVIFCAHKLKEQGFKFFWSVVGDGDEREKLENLAAENNVSDCVIFEGAKVNPYPYVKNADLYVHPSYVESQGLTVLEAMTLGVPCVVTKSRGPCEYIEDGVNGLLTEQSPESLAKNVERILKDRELYEKIKSNTRCPEQFSPEAVMGKIESLLEE